MVLLSFFNYQWYPRTIESFTTVTFWIFSVQNCPKLLTFFFLFSNSKHKKKFKVLKNFEQKKFKKVTVVKRTVIEGIINNKKNLRVPLIKCQNLRIPLIISLHNFTSILFGVYLYIYYNNFNNFFWDLLDIYIEFQILDCFSRLGHWWWLMGWHMDLALELLLAHLCILNTCLHYS